MGNKEIYRLNINNLNAESANLAFQSFKRYGAFLIENVFSTSDVLKVRGYCSKLFLKPGDKRLRYLREFKNKKDILNFSYFFTNEKLLNSLYAVFKNDNLYLLPPYNIARNYLPHSYHTDAMGWHRDCNGELNYKECISRLKNRDYMFAKIGIYLQENSSYGGAIDIIPGSNNDQIGKSKLSNLNNFYVGVIVFVQKYLNFFYKKTLLRKFLMKLMKSETLRVNQGDIVIFDSRTMHKGTFADEEIESQLEYNHAKLQANLPEIKTKYVLYSHLGNTLGLESYFIDRLKRDNNTKEMENWIKDQEKVSELDLKNRSLIPSLKLFKSLLTKSKLI